MRGATIRAQHRDGEGNGALTAVACVLAAALLYFAGVIAWGADEDLIEGSSEWSWDGRIGSAEAARRSGPADALGDRVADQRRRFDRPTSSSRAIVSREDRPRA